MTPHRLKEIETLGECVVDRIEDNYKLKGAVKELVGELHRIRSQLKIAKPEKILCWKCGKDITETPATCGDSAIIVGCELDKYRRVYKIHLCHTCHGSLYNSDAEGLL
jgi:hypothetical protein